ncbi:MAG: GNAT family N-acetyltransferase [Pseudomonadota bacterium]
MTEFRTATEAELSTVLDWAAREGWNPGLDDAAAFFATDPEGFFVAVEGDALVAAISVVNHTEDFAFLGLYIARPSHRGKGVGYGLWKHAIQHAGRRTIGLDGVPEQQGNYAASGFHLAGGTTRFAGHIAPAEQKDVRTVQDSDIPGLIDQEAQASGVRKEAYLSGWFTNTPHRVTLIDDAGFCTVRACRDGAKIGPLLAPSKDAARRLMQHASAVMGPDVMIDVPAGSVDLAQLCAELGLEPGFETARMYRGDHPGGDGTLYAVTSLELG